MSHFTVLVIGEDPEMQLAPFQENNVGTCPQEYMKYRVCDDKGNEHRFDSEEAFQKSGVVPEDDENKGYRENPNAKWDWYLLGGRWAGFFKTKNGASGEVGTPSLLGIAQGQTIDEGSSDSLRKCDIDWEGMKISAAENAENIFKEAHEALVKYNHNRGIIQTLYGVGETTTLEELKQSEIQSTGITFAVLKDGQWFQRGKMGWRGYVSDKKDKDVRNTEYHKLLESLPDDTLLSVYDCHI